MDMRTQSSLGSEFRRLYNEDTNLNKMILARVINVNYRYNTVDVQAIDSGMTINKSGQDGRFAAKLPIEFGGRTADGKPFGQVTPIEVGSMVLVGFVNNHKSKPIVISVYNSADEEYELGRAPFSRVDPRDESLKQQANHKFTVYPSLTYEDIDGNGNRTMTFPGKSFLTIDGDTLEDMSGVTDDGDGYGYDQLDSSHYYSGELIEPKSGMAPTILFRHVGDRYNDEGEIIEDPHALMLYINPDGTYRTSIVNKDEDWKTYTELDADGNYTIRRQNDSKGVGKGDEYHELSVGKEGITLRSGTKYLLFNQDGMSGNVSGLGGGSSEDLSGLVGKLDELGGTILRMGTKIEKTDEYIRLSAEQVSAIDDKVRDLDASFEIRADQIQQSVTETITEMVDENLKEMSQDLSELQEDAQEAMTELQELSADNKLTSIEKKTVFREWDMIRAEYPGYKEQAELVEISTEDYSTAYTRLKDYVEPILAKPDTTSEIDRIVFNSMFQNYYVARGNTLYDVFAKLKQGSDEAAQKAIDASIDAGDALADSAIAKADASKANRLLEDIAEDDKITPQEKPALLREYNSILYEWEDYVNQAITYSISSLAFEQAKDEVIDFVETNNIFSSMNSINDINGEELQQVFANYYAERAALLAEVASTTKGILDDFSGDLEYYNTQITSTSREISLVAESVKMLGERVSVNQAELSVQSHMISSRVTRTDMSRYINETLDKLNSGGRNLYVYSTASSGELDTSTGEVSSSEDGEVSNFIKVDGNTNYIATITDNPGLNTLVVNWYDRNRQFLSGRSVSGTEETLALPLVSPTGAAYARTSYNHTDVAKLQFEQGTISTPHKVAPEDMITEVSVATEERNNRKEMLDYYEARLQSYKANGIQDLSTVETISADGKLNAIEKESLSEIFDAIVDEQETIRGEAAIYQVSSVALQGAYTSLASYNTPLLEDTSTESNVMQSSIVNLYDNYFEQRNRVYSSVVNSARGALEAAEAILDNTTESAFKAQEVANDLAREADAMARSVTETRNNINLANQYEAEAMGVINRVAEDANLSPTEKVDVKGIVTTINEELEGLLIQAGAYSLSTIDIENAVMMLTSYFSAFITLEESMKNTTINTQTFKTYFENYFTAKATLLQNILDGAKGAYDKVQNDSSVAYQEYLRRQEQLIVYQNVVKDTQLDIERLNEDIETLSDNIAYSYRITSSNGTIFKDNNIETTLTAQLFRGNEDITDSVLPEHFVWTKTNADGTENTAWNNAHEGVGNVIELTEADVQEKAVFDIEIYTVEEDN